MVTVEMDRQIEIDAENFWSVYPKKSKRFCAFCDDSLGRPTKEQLKKIKGIIFVSSITFSHKKFKSKKIKLCGPCANAYQRIRAGS